MPNRPEPEKNLINLRAVKLPALSEAGESVIVLDGADNTLKQSTNGAAYAALGGGGGGGAIVHGGIYSLNSTAPSSPGALNTWKRILPAETQFVAGAMSAGEFRIGGSDSNGLEYIGTGGDFLINAVTTYDSAGSTRWLARVVVNRNEATTISQRLSGAGQCSTNAWEVSIAITPQVVTLATNDVLEWYIYQAAGGLASYDCRWTSITATQVG